MKRFYGLAGVPTSTLCVMFLAGSVALSGCGGAASNPASSGPPPAPPAGYTPANEAKVAGKGGKAVNLIDESDGGGKGPAARAKKKN